MPPSGVSRSANERKAYASLHSCFAYACRPFSSRSTLLMECSAVYQAARGDGEHDHETNQEPLRAKRSVSGGDRRAVAARRFSFHATLARANRPEARLELVHDRRPAVCVLLTLLVVRDSL